MYVMIALYLVAGGVFAVLCLPVAIQLLILRPGTRTPVEVRLDIGLAAGLAGLRASGPTGGWMLRPLLAGLPVPGPRLAMGGTPAPPAPSAEPEGEPGTEQVEPPTEPAATGADKGSRLRQLRWAAGLVARPALRLVRSLGRTVTVSQVSVSGQLGHPDPSRTGQIWGWLQALDSGGWDRLHLDLTPDFADARTRGQLDVRLRFHLGLLLLLLVRFGLQVGWRWGLDRVAALGWRNRSPA